MENEPRKFYLHALLKKARRDTAKKDILWFAQYYLPHYVKDAIPLFHKEIYKLLQTENRLAIAAPRGFAKSTIVQIIYGLWCLLFNEEEDILTISASADLADEWIRKIKIELENNERIKEDFGNLLDWGENISKRWTHNHLILHRGSKIFSQVRSRGRGCQVRGFRPSKVIADDLEDEELVRSEEQRRYLKEWFLGALLNVLRTDQQLIIIGTILHPLALLSKVIQKKEEFEGWETKKYVALIESGSIWEARFPRKDLEKRKFEIGTYAFQAEYQNNPISSDICLWKPEWLRTYDRLPQIKEKFMAIDPATSLKESADHTGIVAWGIGEDNKIYELESVKGRWGMWDFCDRVIRTYQKHDPLRLGIEEIGFQQIIRPVLIKEARKRGIYLRITPITLGKYREGEKRVSRDKFSRAYSVIHLFEQDLVRLKSQDLIDQLATFPTGAGDDLVDAAVHGLNLIQRYAQKAQIFQKPEMKREIRGFEVHNQRMPCLSSIEECFARVKDWRIGG